jgi:N-acetylglucosaminyl-diphospho-decaprenol L-rhamnosyltransferase
MFTHYSGLSRFGKHLGVLRGHYLLPDQVRGRHEVDWVTGACLAIRADTWSAIGGITDRWFMYAEDIELCFKVRRAGLTVVLDSGSTVSHLVGGSTGASAGPIRSDWIVNLFDFYRADMSPNPAASATWKIVVALGLLSRAVLFSVRAKLSGAEAWRLESKKFFAYARAVANVRLKN